MATYQIQLFGITREIIGANVLTLEHTEEMRVSDLLAQLKSNYPALERIKSLLVAINAEYAEASQNITPSDEIALIPPVSGG